jgi:hypothetical protein
LADNFCTVLIATLREEPYSLEWGASIYIKVLATNIVGSSAYTIGNDAILVTIPDAPVNLADVPEITSHTEVGLSWEDGYSDGGSPIIDYRIFKSTNDVDYEAVMFGITEK